MSEFFAYLVAFLFPGFFVFCFIYGITVISRRRKFKNAVQNLREGMSKECVFKIMRDFKIVNATENVIDYKVNFIGGDYETVRILFDARNRVVAVSTGYKRTYRR